MSRVPRIHDGIRIERTDAGDWAVLAQGGGELFRLTESGYFLLQQMDGVGERGEVLQRYEERFGEVLAAEDLDAWIGRLESSGALVRDSRAARILAYLAEQDASFRRPFADRRERGGRGDPRRDEASPVALWFDHAVFLLNEGLLAEGTSVFERIAQARPGDVRVQEIVRHLRFLATAESPMGLVADRRDVSWEAFDAALREMLGGGKCPRCGAAFTVELGGTNRCRSCGAGFSAWVLEQSTKERRGR